MTRIIRLSLVQEHQTIELTKMSTIEPGDAIEFSFQEPVSAGSYLEIDGYYEVLNKIPMQ
ncbi:hypothetical protein ACQVP2_35235 [Methylobacterium aquaticum]|uniref:hypothetical protein n=1 Tax=Methylobacterium aquaticum TaxID=270351 RepID=UPI003D163FBE